MKYLFLSAMLFCTPVQSTAQSIETALNCSKRIGHGTEYSGGGRIRVDQAFLCISQDRKKASLHYRASAMHNDKYVGRDNAPWLWLSLHDGNGRQIYESSSFDLVNVERCGGYTGHWKVVPISASDVAKVEFVEISVGSTGRRSCSPQGWDRVRYDVTQTVTRWASGDLTEAERKIFSVIQGGGF